jgi:hypothetical protein
MHLLVPNKNSHFSLTATYERILERLTAGADRESSWREFLRELRDSLERVEALKTQPKKRVEKADLIESEAYFGIIQRLDFSDFLSLAVRDRLFCEVFGWIGEQLITEKRAEVQAALIAYQARTGIADAREAGRQLRKEMENGIEAAVAFLQQRKGKFTQP